MDINLAILNAFGYMPVCNIWCDIDIHMFLYGLLGTTYIIIFYYLCVVHNNLSVKYQLCLNKLFSVSVSVFMMYLKNKLKVEFITLLYARTAGLLLLYSLLIKWTEDHKQYSVIQSS